MKKLLAMLIALTLALSCLSGTAMAEGYKSRLLKKTIRLPSKMALVDEVKLDDGSGVEFTFSVEGQPDASIYVDAQNIKEFKGYTMAKLPDEVLDSWTENYYQYYPENATAGRLPSDDKKGDELYCYCGQGTEDGSILVYTSVQDELCVTSYCISESVNMSKLAMEATLEALNAVNAAIAKNNASGSQAAPVYNHKNYDVEYFFLILLDEDDDDDLDLYDDDDDFDFDYDDWDDWDDDYDDYDDLDDYDYDDDYDDGYDDYEDYGDYDDGGYEDYGDYDDGGYEDYGDYDDGGDW